MAEYPIKFRLEAETAGAEAGLRRVKEQTEEMAASVKGAGTIMQGVLGIVSAYAGTRGLMGLVSASEEANRTLIKSQFFLRGMGGDTMKNMEVLKRWGAEVQRNIGINDEFAVLVASRLAPRIRDLNKIQEYATVLLKGHRIGVLDAESASIMLMRASEGNARALAWLAWQLGITIHEFESMDSIMAKLDRRLGDVTRDLSPFEREWEGLRLTLEDLLEMAGLPLVRALGRILGGIRRLITDIPILRDIFVTVAPVIAGALALMGLGTFLATVTGLSKALKISAGVFGFWFTAVAFALGGAIWFYTEARKHGDKFLEAVKRNMPILIAVFYAVGLALWGPIGGLILSFLFILSVWFADYISKYELSWKGFKEYLGDLWGKMKLGAQVLWEEILGILKGAWERAVELGKKIWGGFADWFQRNIIDWFRDKFKWIEEKYRGIMDMWERAKEAAREAVVGVRERVRRVLPRREFGGYIPVTGPYLLHRGEMVIPAGRGGAAAINITITGNTFMADEAGAVKIGDMIIRVLQRQLRI